MNCQLLNQFLTCRDPISVSKPSSCKSTGPYAPAVLRLQISFPDLYPDLPLLITFSTDIFHPLVVPLTTYTFSTGAAETNDTVSATDEERLPSGAFSLRHGFPQWFGRSGKGRGSQRDSRRASNNIELAQDNGSERPWGSSSSYNLASTQRPSILKVLEYVKASFGNPTVLDDLPLEAAANPGAWHAWRSHRGLPKAVSETVSPTRIKVGSEQTVQKKPGDWNWEGVWEKRASSGIEASISEATLFGGPRGGSQSNDMVCRHLSPLTRDNGVLAGTHGLT